MNETAEVATNLPAIILLSFWWALLSMLQILARPDRSTETPTADRPSDEAPVPEDDQDFPELREADPEFRSAAFLQGACRAYEAILGAYALYDAKALRTLLSAEVFRAFADAFEARSARGETLELTFVGMQSAEIAGVEVRPDAIEIAVLFRAQVIQAERSATGELIRGDPEDVAVVADLWTFSRARPVRTTAWTVIATQAPRETA